MVVVGVIVKKKNWVALGRINGGGQSESVPIGENNAVGP